MYPRYPRSPIRLQGDEHKTKASRLGAPLCHNATKSSLRMVPIFLPFLIYIHDPIVPPFVIVADPPIVGPIVDKRVRNPGTIAIRAAGREGKRIPLPVFFERVGEAPNRKLFALFAATLVGILKQDPPLDGFVDILSGVMSVFCNLDQIARTWITRAM